MYSPYTNYYTKRRRHAPTTLEWQRSQYGMTRPARAGSQRLQVGRDLLAQDGNKWEEDLHVHRRP
eukprot:6491805-Amphidinium_carterae.2